MPTIDDLPAAVSVSDTDELMVSQSDIARKATRAQLLAGVQPALAVPSGSLLGRLSAGLGAPETILLGENLTAANGVLSAPAPFVIDALPAGAAPGAADQVALGQGGQNAAVSYAAFMGALSALGGIDGSNLTVAVTGGVQARRMADCLADALSVEDFGAVGDGVTDDTAAFAAAAAAATGRPLRLDGRVYIVNGPLTLSGAAMVGVAGATILRRTKLAAAAAWIVVDGPCFRAEGVVFDAGGLAGVDMPAVAVQPPCLHAVFTACGFLNATGPTSGSGLSVDGAAGAVCQVTRCALSGNALHGVDAAGLGTVVIDGCTAANNAGCGVRVEPGAACMVRNNACISNGTGISVGAWNAGAAGAVATPVGAGCMVIGNGCTGNAGWGIAVAAGGAAISGNAVQAGSGPGAGGILARLGASRLCGNIVRGGVTGIDARGCWGSLIAENHVSGAGAGLTVGGSQNMRVCGNILLANGWGIVVSAIEPGLSFVPTGAVTVSGNWIGFTTAQGGGIQLLDAAQGVAVTDNDINGWGSASLDQALWLHTDAAVARGNRWNNQARFTAQANAVAGLEALVVPDVADEVLVTSAPAPIASVLTNHQADTLGQIVFIKVTAGGAGYTQAQIAIAGTGTGAAATAVVSNGSLCWIVVTNPGSGYGPVGAAVTVTITGDGSGAMAAAYAGLPVLEGRRLRLACNCQMQLALAGSSPPQTSWTGFASTVPAFGAVDLEGVFGSWRAVNFPPVDYLSPTGDGGAILQTVAGGSLVLRPASGGALHIASGAEASGCTSSVGRGSPLGAVAAPPGSDFRNLNGGPGNTFWVKQANTDATGWMAIA